MTASFTTGKGDLEKPANGDNVDTWNVPVNANMDAIDACLSATVAITSTGGTVTLSQPQMRCQRVAIFGTLASDLTLNFFAGISGFYVVVNVTVPNGHTITLGQTGGGGQTVSLNTGASVHTCVYVDGLGDVALADIGGILTIASQQITPPGMIADFAMAGAPTGWLFCDGSAVSRTTYAPLYTNIGTIWGAGNGSTTFNLPDFRGYFRRGWDTGVGVDPGRAFASLQADALKSHTHGTNENPHTHTAPVSGAVNAAGFNNTSPLTGGSNSVTTSGAVTGLTIVATPAPTPNETRPINYAVLTCIKT